MLFAKHFKEVGAERATGRFTHQHLGPERPVEHAVSGLDRGPLDQHVD